MPKTKREITELKRALNTIKKCNGDCKYCNKFHIYIKDCGRSIFMAYGCDAAPMLSYISDSIRILRREAIEILEFEMRI